MTNNKNKTSLSKAALLAGLGLLVMVIAAPYAELFVYPKLVIPDNATETVKNIVANKALFISAIFSYLVTFICDVVVAWGLYVLLKPVNENLSLLTAWFRLVYTVIALVALLNLVNVLQLLNTPDYIRAFKPDQLHAQVMVSFNSFRHDWYFGLLFFGIHLGLLGYLVFRSNYIPRIFGVLLIIAGFGYLITTLKPYLFPSLDSDIARYTFYGELIFMLWLLFKGSRIKEADKEIIWFESVSYE